MKGEERRLSRSDLTKSWLLWTFFSHSCYNYERLQALGFAHSMTPVIRKLYHTREEISAALKRHLVFFNTEPNVGHVIHGITGAMEEQRAGGAPISDEAINSLKMGLMGPLAGVGDSITQGTLAPILIAIGVGLAREGNLAGPLVYVLLVAAAIWGIAYTMFSQGYRLGKAAVERILESGRLQDLVNGSGIVGAMVLGGLVGRFVTLSTKLAIKIGQTNVVIQDVLNKIMPGLLPLALTLGTLWLLRKGRNPITVMVILVVTGVIGSLIKVF
ncbi:MAG: PTS system mannose/fructose/sorbose family transporter subunit IID [Firmicutes bacterium]|nr:PTS system mannose/fructose/sorbose family transporter subunit IID [Bacillota bacterium]